MFKCPPGLTLFFKNELNAEKKHAVCAVPKIQDVAHTSQQAAAAETAEDSEDGGIERTISRVIVDGSDIERVTCSDIAEAGSTN